MGRKVYHGDHVPLGISISMPRVIIVAHATVPLGVLVVVVVVVVVVVLLPSATTVVVSMLSPCSS